MKAADDNQPYGLLAEFESPQALVQAARRVREAGYRAFDAFSPYPMQELSAAMGLGVTKLPLITLIGAVLGGALGYGMQYYSAVVAYPWDVGGKPHHSWPMFVPVTFELAILLGALGAVVGMILLNGLPRPHHPLFDAPGFSRASQDRFFLCIESRDSQFDLDATRRFLQQIGAKEVITVER